MEVAWVIHYACYEVRDQYNSEMIFALLETLNCHLNSIVHSWMAVLLVVTCLSVFV